MYTFRTKGALKEQNLEKKSRRSLGRAGCVFSYRAWRRRVACGSNDDGLNLVKVAAPEPSLNAAAQERVGLGGELTPFGPRVGVAAVAVDALGGAGTVVVHSNGVGAAYRQQVSGDAGQVTPRKGNRCRQLGEKCSHALARAWAVQRCEKCRHAVQVDTASCGLAVTPASALPLEHHKDVIHKLQARDRSAARRGEEKN
jgi:hypothetical protein